ncbi:MAG TPA: FAD-dependent 5-carboxymethylaminomethyl-2-thiouridine(34) oxidoreductase MnmC, partial [Rubrivivax sp.]|nr:FAD-dependent 5-carboxymethylaminomethyl-2-thiouridine(34) oxidoreductase MnmC [Rubrivivax sp.]
GAAGGLLRLELGQGGLDAMRATLHKLGLPADYVQALDAATAAQRAGVPIGTPTWFYPGGGWVDPPAWVRHALATPGVHFIGGAAVATVERHGSDWLLRDCGGRALAQSPVVVLAHAAGAARLLAPLGGPSWPLAHSRGQVTQVAAHATHLTLRLPLAGDGYALPLPEGGLLCGATNEAAEPDGDDTPREADHLFNLQRLQRLVGQPPPDDLSSCQGRVGWRLHSDDRLPIAGAVPLPAAGMVPGQRLDQARLLPRHQGLFVLAALGSRGLTLAPMLGRLVAAQATGMPWPLEQDLADAVDPGRWMVRAARAAVPAQPGVRSAARLQPG